MIINARRVFRCNHSWVAVRDGGITLFSCMTCKYRTELLPIRFKAPPSQVIAFPGLTSDRISETVTRAG